MLRSCRRQLSPRRRTPSARATRVGSRTTPSLTTNSLWVRRCTRAEQVWYDRLRVDGALEHEVEDGSHDAWAIPGVRSCHQRLVSLLVDVSAATSVVLHRLQTFPRSGGRYARFVFFLAKIFDKWPEVERRRAAAWVERIFGETERVAGFPMLLEYLLHLGALSGDEHVARDDCGQLSLAGATIKVLAALARQLARLGFIEQICSPTDVACACHRHHPPRAPPSQLAHSAHSASAPPGRPAVLGACARRLPRRQVVDVPPAVPPLGVRAVRPELRSVRRRSGRLPRVPPGGRRAALHAGRPLCAPAASRAGAGRPRDHAAAEAGRRPTRLLSAARAARVLLGAHVVAGCSLARWR